MVDSHLFKMSILNPAKVLASFLMVSGKEGSQFRKALLIYEPT
jgi:hypothetical protein